MSAEQKRNFVRATVQGTFWTYAAVYGSKLMFFISTIILARLLTKEDFGIVGYAVTAISFLDVLSNLGVGAALIYYREEPDIANTAFWLGLLVGLILFGLTWLMAPFVGIFFNDLRAVSVTRLLGLTFPLNALGDIPYSLLSKNLAFNRKFIPTYARALSKGLASIILALLGFGFWSLIIGQIVGSAVWTTAVWFVSAWRPALRFARHLARPLLTYGLNIVSIDVLGVVLQNADYLFVGRFFGAAALGVYTLAFRIPELLIVQFCNVISSVIFPVYAQMRDEPGALSRAFLTTMRYVALVTVPIGLGLALVARPFVLTVFTAKWEETIEVMRAISLYALFLSLFYNTGSAYKAQGLPQILTKLALVRAILLVPALWWAATGPATILAVAWVQVGVTFLGGTLNLIVAGRKLGAPLTMIIAALRPSLIAGMLMALAVLMTLALSTDLTPLTQLILNISIGALVYTGALWWLEREFVMEASRTLRMAMSRA